MILTSKAGLLSEWGKSLIVMMFGTVSIAGDTRMSCEVFTYKKKMDLRVDLMQYR